MWRGHIVAGPAQLVKYHLQYSAEYKKNLTLAQRHFFILLQYLTPIISNIQ